MSMLSSSKFVINQKVKHKKFGAGTVIKVNKTGNGGTDSVSYSYDVMFKFPYGQEFGVLESKLEAV